MESKQTLRLMPALESPHLTFALSRWLMRKLGKIIGVLGGVVGRRLHSTTGGWPVAAKLVGDQPPRLLPLARHNFTQKTHGGFGVVSALNENFQYVTVLVDGAPAILLTLRRRTKCH